MAHEEPMFSQMARAGQTMPSNLLAMASTLETIASNLLAMASNLETMASNLLAMASNLVLRNCVHSRAAP